MTSLTEKFWDLEASLGEVVLERFNEIHGASLALITNEHHFTLGTPGIAKTMLADQLVQRVDGLAEEDYFSVLLMRSTPPEEIFGVLDMKELQEGVYKRQTKGMLPNAKIATIDEALSLDTPIMTPDGWATIGDIEIGDHVFGSHGTPVQVIGLTPIKNDAICYRVTFSDGESIIADAGHNWMAKPTRSAPSKETTIWTTQEMFDSGRKFYVPESQAIELPAQSYSIDPYVLGLWLGNGNNFNGALYIRDEFLDRTLEEVQRRYPAARHDSWISDHMARITMAGTGFRTELRKAGLIANKFLPSEYLIGSIEQRLELIRGLMDTDGSSVPGQPTCVFSNTNESIIDGFIGIIRSLGLLASKKPTKDDRIGKKGPHKPCWKVTFRGDKIHPFLARSTEITHSAQVTHHRIVSIELADSVPVRCLTVDSDDHLFLAGVNMAVTHNCFKGSATTLNGLLWMLNERWFKNHNEDKQRPLMTAFSMSNELAESDGLHALWDRLLFRYHAEAISDTSNFMKMLTNTLDPNPAKVIDIAEIEAAHTAAKNVVIPDMVLLALKNLKDSLKAKGIDVTDRRWRRCVSVIRAEAWMGGKEEAEISDLKPLAHVLWNDVNEINVVHAEVRNLADPLEAKAVELFNDITSTYETYKEQADSNDDRVAKTKAGLRMFQKYKDANSEFDDLAKKIDTRRSDILTKLKKKLNRINEELSAELSAQLDK